MAKIFINTNSPVNLNQLEGKEKNMIYVTKDKARDDFFNILETVQNGEHIVILGDGEHEKLAVIRPYRNDLKKDGGERVLGILKGKAEFKINDNFKITDEELLSL